MKKCVFVLGGLGLHFAKTGDVLSDAEITALEEVGKAAEVDVSVVLACESTKYVAKKPPMKALKEERPRLVEQINAEAPDYVVCFGPVAIAAVFGKGNMVQREMLRQTHEVEDIPCPIIVTHSLEHAAVAPGLKKWMRLDVTAAVQGYTDTEWGEYTYVRPTDSTWGDWPAVFRDLPYGSIIGFDLETYPGLSPWDENARIRMAILSTEVGQAHVVLTNEYGELPAWVTRIAADSTLIKAGSNIKFDYRWMHRFGYRLRNMHDTSTADHILDETNPLKDLKSLTFRYLPRLGDYSKAQRDLVKQRGGWEHIEDEEMLQYAGGDGEASVAAALAQTKSLREKDLFRPFRLAMHLYQVLADMECRGACIDVEKNRELDVEFDAAIAEVRTRITDVLGPINPNSPIQLADALQKAIPEIDLKKRQFRRYFEERLVDEEDYSTAKDVLEREAHRHPVIADLLLYRRLTKLHGTYVKGIFEKHLTSHGSPQSFIHPSFRTDVTETNRLSSSKPNGQNIPRKPDPDDPHPIPEHLNIKKQFVSRFDGGHIMEVDLSQAEMRVAAWMSRDPALIDVLTAGGDVHKNTASLVYEKKLDDVSSLERHECKRVNFLTLYGGGANTLARQIGCTKDRAKELLAQYFRTFPRLDRYIKQIHVRVQRDLFVESPFGYRRRFERPWKWMSRDGWRIQRQAWNMIVQNTAAAICYVGMIALERMMRDAQFKSVIILQVHDSVVIDVYPGEENNVAIAAKLCMEGPPLHHYGVDDFDIPLVADVEMGETWGDKKEFAIVSD